MISARKAHESAKTRAQSVRADRKAEPAEKQQPNLLWQQLATRVQTKLSVSAPNDPYEREADQVADRVMRMPEPTVQRSCASCASGAGTCPKCEEEKKQRAQVIQRKPQDSGDARTSLPDEFLSGMGSGQPLDRAARAFMESRIGHDFGSIRVHTGERAAQSAQALNAQAYTAGNNVVFAANRYNPATRGGRWLLAHELAHTVQQQSNPSPNQVLPYRDVKASEKSMKNWGAIDDPAAGLVEKAAPGKGDPVIETIHVHFTGKAPDLQSPGELLVTGTLTAKYRAADKRPDIVIPVTGGTTADRPFGLTDRIGGKGAKVHKIQGPGYNEKAVTGHADAQPAPKGEFSHYVKKTATVGHAAFDFASSMGLAVYFKGSQAIHLGDKTFGSHACIHVDWTANKEQMRLINYHSQIGFTTVTVEYDKNSDFQAVCCAPTRKKRGFVNPCDVFKESDCP